MSIESEIVYLKTEPNGVVVSKEVVDLGDGEKVVFEHRTPTKNKNGTPAAEIVRAALGIDGHDLRKKFTADEKGAMAKALLEVSGITRSEIKRLGGRIVSADNTSSENKTS